MPWNVCVLENATMIIQTALSKHHQAYRKTLSVPRYRYRFLSRVDPGLTQEFFKEFSIFWASKNVPRYNCNTSIPMPTVLVKCQAHSRKLPPDTQKENDGFRTSAGSKRNYDVAPPISAVSLEYSHIPNLCCSVYICWKSLGVFKQNKSHLSMISLHLS